MAQRDSLCGDDAGDLGNHQGCPPAILHVLSQAASNPERGTHAQRALVERAKHYVASNLGERIRLAGAGRALGVSAQYLTSVFRRVEGLPFYQYVLRKKLERAVALLTYSAGDLSQLALELGFSSHSHFSAAFGRAFGCAPGAVRAQGQALRRCSTASRTASPASTNPMK
jgi:AraC family transcriptional regulator